MITLIGGRACVTTQVLDEDRRILKRETGTVVLTETNGD